MSDRGITERLKRIIGLSEKPIAPSIPFRLFPGQRTHPPHVVSYVHFGYGYLPATKETALHYYRFRPWLGAASDPSELSGKLRTRLRVAQGILSQEKTAEQQALWERLFCRDPTHVLHFGWKSLSTAQSYDVLYLGLNFAYPHLDAERLAPEFSDYFLALLPVLSAYDLCPPSRDLRLVQEFLLTLAFRHYYWFLLEKPKRLHL